MNQESSGRVLNLPLLQDLLHAEFNSNYSINKKKNRSSSDDLNHDTNTNTNTNTKENENRVYFCVDCRGESLTKSEVDEHHVNHRTLRAMKCSNSYGYIKQEIIRVLPKDIIRDLSRVYDFKINDHSIYFPKSRNNKNLGNNNIVIKDRCCIKCKHVLPKYGYEYCSIDCLISCTNHDWERHLELMKSNDQNQVRLPPLMKKKRKTANEKSESKKNKRQKNVSSGSGLGVDLESLAMVATEEADGKKQERNGGLSYRKRSRKGIPRRAPFY